MKNYLLLALFLLTSNLIFAQANASCGINREAAIQRLLQSKAIIRDGLIAQTEETKYIPIKFHLVGDSDGQNRVTIQEVLQTLCEINQEFSSVGFHFYIKDEMNFINSSFLNTYVPSSTETQNICNASLDTSAINIFIVQEISSLGSNANPLSLYELVGDWIVVEDGLPPDKLFASHGLGHFFSVLHTGYRDFSWNPSTNAPNTMEIDTSSSCAQNCETTGDLICDTPPDYNEFAVSTDCTYSGSATDYCGTAINPMIDNIMAFSGCPNSTFTPGQAQVMQADYLKPERDYIHSGYIPNTGLISQSVTLFSPANYASITSSQVTLDWNDVPNATQYALELSQTANFSLMTEQYIVPESQYTLTLNEANQNYFWRVIPFSDGVTCTSELVSPTWRFQINPSSSLHLADINQWSIQPNPAISAIQLVLKMIRATDITVQIMDMRGTVILSEKHHITTGEQFINLTPDLRPGTYFVKILSNDAYETQRLIVVR